MSARGTTNTNARGSASQRRVRKLWLLRTYGDGVTCRCVECDRLLDYWTLFVDRIVPGCLGGRYVRGNIRPHCSRCSSLTGTRLREALKVTA